MCLKMQYNSIIVIVAGFKVQQHIYYLWNTTFNKWYYTQLCVKIFLENSIVTHKLLMWETIERGNFIR